MERPYIICHMLSSVNGKIEGDFIKTSESAKMASHYARIRMEYQADGWLYGTETTKEFTNYAKAGLAFDHNVHHEDFVAVESKAPYYVSVDPKGEIGWSSEKFSRGGLNMHVIEVLTESAPISYRAYLRKKGVCYILAGKKELNCVLAVEKLYKLFGIRTLVMCGGGAVNWSFLRSGVVDELSLIISATVEGKKNAVTVFDKPDFFNDCRPVCLKLKSMERIEENGLRLVYTINYDENKERDEDASEKSYVF